MCCTAESGSSGEGCRPSFHFSQAAFSGLPFLLAER